MAKSDGTVKSVQWYRQVFLMVQTEVIRWYRQNDGIKNNNKEIDKKEKRTKPILRFKLRNGFLRPALRLVLVAPLH